MANNEQILQLDPIVVTPDGVVEEDSLLSRILGQFDATTVNKIINRGVKRVKKDVTKSVIGGEFGSEASYKSLAKQGQKLAASDKPLTVIEEKVGSIAAEYGSVDYLAEVGAEAALTEGEIALNKQLKSTGLQLNLPTDITDINKMYEGDYSDLTQGGFSYDLGKGWKVRGDVNVDERGQVGGGLGIHYKKKFNQPISELILNAFKNTFKKESDTEY